MFCSRQCYILGHSIVGPHRSSPIVKSSTPRTPARCVVEYYYDTSLSLPLGLKLGDKVFDVGAVSREAIAVQLSYRRHKQYNANKTTLLIPNKNFDKHCFIEASLYCIGNNIASFRGQLAALVRTEGICIFIYTSSSSSSRRTK